MKSIYLLPHYDDEIFVIPKIRQDLASGHSPLFVFFMSSPLRSNESIKFLGKLGVAKESIILLGEKFQVPDGSLLNFLPQFYTELLSQVGGEEKMVEIICPAFEGGHHDHDAISLLGRALANSWSCEILEFFLYHGYGTKGKIYRVASPLFAEKKKTYRYSFEDRVRLLGVPFTYISQLKSMLGLWPFLVVKSILKPLVFRVSSGHSLMIDSHGETPSYERWGRITEKQFIETAMRFCEITPIFNSNKFKTKSL